jgi:hypothetical protein
MPLRLDRFPISRHVHVLADFAELLCNANADGLVSGRDFEDRLRPVNAIGADPAAGEAGESGEANRNDRRRVITTDVIRVLESREQSMGTSYPFSVVSDTLRARRRLNSSAKLYLYLLFAASGPCFSLSVQRRLNAGFESIAAHAVEAYLGPQWTFRRFGTSDRSPQFRGGLYRRLEQLAEEIREKLIANPTDYAGIAGGDDGIDFVAWIPFPDGLPSQLIVLGQATCLAGWPDKQAEVSVDRIRPRFHFLASHIPILCIPYMARTSSNTWARETDIHQAVLFDRKRILDSIGERAARLVPLGTQAYQDAVNWREPAVG